MEKHNLESTVKTYLNKLNAETSRALTAEVKGVGGGGEE
jgi:E3 ubiquitin-protein ligase DZIP3